MTPKKPIPTPFSARLAALTPASARKEPSEARNRVRDEFEAITAARARTVTWQQIADEMAADGIMAADGEPLTADELRAMYHNERASQGLRKKRVAKPRAPAATSTPIQQPTQPQERPRRFGTAMNPRTPKEE